MPTTTAATGWPLPLPTDDPDVVDDMTKLAQAIEKNAVGVYPTVAERDTKTASVVAHGMFAFTKDTNTLWYRNATAWVQFPPVTPIIRSGTAAPSNAVGINGDVYFRY